jgi:uncharacterized protein YqjF (DUF2071 family)
VTRPFLRARWRDLLLLTYAVPDDLALPLVPSGCDADRWDGRCHVSLVALQMERVRIRGIAVPGLTSYPQVNLRLYVRHAGRAAVHFVQELVPSRLLAAAAHRLYGEPFRGGPIKARTEEREGAYLAEYLFGLDQPRWRVAVQAAPHAEVPASDTFEHWVKERVRGCRTDRAGHLRTFDVTHPPWGVRAITAIEIRVGFGELYGDTWALLDTSEPVSVVSAEGSEVTVSAPV